MDNSLTGLKMLKIVVFLPKNSKFGEILLQFWLKYLFNHFKFSHDHCYGCFDEVDMLKIFNLVIAIPHFNDISWYIPKTVFSWRPS